MTREDEIAELQRMFYFMEQRRSRYGGSARWRVGDTDRTQSYLKLVSGIADDIEKLLELHNA
ncbi:MAG: hypothetical protein HEQ34_02130 [Sphingorhabdus sp.]|uniref:hypothetical protein n=1 Tax=Sphingorhabdus sp. TaxID=1902408 RepID=UPI0025D19D23|nr:hypothetical protein [Sphingorhabdus sp.]MCO4090735.1 hypothetical protein [Sphingorhabdus sp.]